MFLDRKDIKDANAVGTTGASGSNARRLSYLGNRYGMSLNHAGIHFPLHLVAP